MPPASRPRAVIPDGTDAFPIDDAEIVRRTHGVGPRRLFGADADEIARLRAWTAGRGVPADVADAEAFVLFVGYPRSGHSLVGAMLDAHPEMAVAHELDVLQFQAAGFDRAQILTLLLENARRIGRLGRRWDPYDYRVPGGWQGRWSRLRVVGDKRGGETSRRLAGDPAALDAFADFIRLPLRCVHVVRHPADNVATMVRRTRGRPRGETADPSDLLSQSLSHYAALARTNRDFLARAGADRAITVWHEDFVAEPRRELARLCRFLGVAVDAAHLDACAGLVAPSPRRSRDELVWSDGQRAALRRIVEGAPFLHRYRDGGSVAGGA
jgi:hypothetical protein